MKKTTLAYLKKDDKFLLIHKNKKNDENKNKYLGIGGKCFSNESIIKCLKREVKEESNFEIENYKFLGKINFYYNGELEIIYLYLIDKFNGELKEECDEGSLNFYSKTEIKKLKMWESDKYFINYVLKGKEFKELDIRYENSVLVEVKHNEKIIYSFSEDICKKLMKKNKDNEIPVRAIVVYKNKIISSSTNLKESKNNCLLHAEMVAINKALKKIKNKYLEECDLYVNLEPCMMCAGAIVQSRIKNLYFISKNSKAGFAISNFNIEQNKAVHHKIKVHQMLKFNQTNSKLLKDFFKNKR